jgi:hypothetical protein
MKAKQISIFFLILVILIQASSKKLKTQTRSNVDTLSQNNNLSIGNSIVSYDGQFTLVFQVDGNLVLYGCFGVAIWASNTSYDSTHTRAVFMQDDGNLVMYIDSVAVWASNTAGKGKGPYYLSMQDDGNLVIYGSTGAIWATGTNESCQLCIYATSKNEFGKVNLRMTYFNKNNSLAMQCSWIGYKVGYQKFCCTPTQVDYTPYSQYASTTDGPALRLETYESSMVYFDWVLAGHYYVDNFYYTNYCYPTYAVSLNTISSIYPKMNISLWKYQTVNSTKCYNIWLNN